MSRLLPSVENREEPNILSHVREVVEYATNGDPLTFPSAAILAELQGWGASAETREIILQVCKARLTLPWPYNYKAMTILALQPPETLVSIKDEIKALAESETENDWVKLYACSLLAAVPLPIEEEKNEEEVWNMPRDLPWGLWAVVSVHTFQSTKGLCRSRLRLQTVLIALTTSIMVMSGKLGDMASSKGECYIAAVCPVGTVSMGMRDSVGGPSLLKERYNWIKEGQTAVRTVS